MERDGWTSAAIKEVAGAVAVAVAAALGPRVAVGSKLLDDADVVDMALDEVTRVAPVRRQRPPQTTASPVCSDARLDGGRLGASPAGSSRPIR